MKNLLLSQFMFLFGWLTAQTALPTATLELTLTTSGGTSNRSGISYNPNQQLYYSVNAGNSSYPIETFDGNGNLVASTSQGFDYRGAWWNPNTNQLEGNGYSSLGIWTQNLDANFFAIGSGTNTVPSTSGPDAQSCGDYDPIDDEILYYNAGIIYRHARSTNTVVSSVSVTGLPVATNNLNWNTIAYTGIPGAEAGLYDYVNKAFYFVNKTTGAFVATCQLPGTAPAADYLKMGFENEYLWLYNGVNQWQGYKVLEQCSASASVITESVCSSFSSPAGNIYTSTGTYYDTIPNSEGCDSIITINLSVNNTTALIQETSCDAFSSPAGNTYTSSGVYYDTIPNVVGCDSIIEIDLIIIPNNLDNTVTVTGSQLWANQLVAGYQWIDCDNDNQPLIGEVNQFLDPINSGNYAVEITADGCSVTSDCFFMDLTSLDENNNMSVKLYPNPVKNYLYIEHNLNEINYKVFDASGRVVIENGIDEKIDLINIDEGVYYIHFEANNIQFTEVFVVRK